MVFSTNLNRQMYVAKAYKTSPATTGDIAVKNNAAKTQMWFLYKGADTLLRSDLIDVDKIMYAKATDSKDMRHYLKSITVALDSDVNSGAPVAGQDYILKINFTQAFGKGDDQTYSKFGAVHAKAGMTAAQFYLELATNLAKNFSTELQPLVKISLIASKTGQDDTTIEVTSSGPTSALTAGYSYSGITITEVEQPWVLGATPKEPVYFTAYTSPITIQGDDIMWSTIESSKSREYYGNGTTVADQEYFYMGERGDLYRNVGWPNTISTKYLVDPTKEYYAIDIHYAFVDSNEGVQKSEKDIYIVCDAKAEANKIINSINAVKANTLVAFA